MFPDDNPDYYEESRRLRELGEDLDAREEREERLARCGPASVTRDSDLKFKCLNCGSEPKVPWCPLCGGGAAA